MSAALLAYWAVRVASTDVEARTVAAIEIARARTVGVTDAEPADQALAARLIGGAAWQWASSGRAPIALEWAEDAIVLARTSGDDQAILIALGGMAIATAFTGGEGVRAVFEEAAEIAERSGVWWFLAMAAGFAGASIAAFDPVAGEALAERGEAAARRSGSPYAISAVAMAHGRMLGHAGRTDEAAERFGTAIAGSEELGDERFALAARSDLAHALRRGDVLTRPRPCTARPSAAGSTSVTAAPSQISSRTSPSSPSSGVTRTVPPACSVRPRRSGRPPARRWRSTRCLSWSGSSIACARPSRHATSTPRGR